MNKLLFNIAHIFDIIICIPTYLIYFPVLWGCLYITKNDIKYPEQRKIVIENSKLLYPKKLFNTWLKGFK